MNFNRENIAVLIYSIALLVIVGGVFLTSTAWDEERALKWIGALSGWAAAGAAAVTLLFIRATLKEAQKANALTQHQTFAVTGELDPVLNYNGTHITKKNLEIFRFWNYNRRAITIVQLTFDCARKGIRVQNFEYVKPNLTDSQAITVKAIGNTVFKTIEIKGTNIGHSPEPCTFNIEFADSFLKAKNCYTPNPVEVEVEVCVHWRFRDENKGNEKVISAIATINPRPLLVD